MGKRRYHKKKVKIKLYRINGQIKAPKVKLIDHKKNLIGIIDTTQALKMAYEQELDLVEVSPKENPPVAKILKYGKFKYSLEKKKQKSKTKKVETKGIRLNLNMAVHDISTRAKQAEKFIKRGSKLQVEMILKGREMAHVSRAFEQIKDFINKLSVMVETAQHPIKKGRRIIAILQPKKIS
ncbi:MAG: translation initiation factor IF-3 [Candidatus Jacksonbacteria bacterium]